MMCNILPLKFLVINDKSLTFFKHTYDLWARLDAIFNTFVSIYACLFSVFFKVLLLFQWDFFHKCLKLLNDKNKLESMAARYEC